MQSATKLLNFLVGKVTHFGPLGWCNDKACGRVRIFSLLRWLTGVKCLTVHTP
jgi:hypothetical protein